MGMVAAIGAGLSAGGAIAGGIQSRRVGDIQQQQANIAAGQAQATAQRSAIDQNRRTDYAISRARAVAASGGGSASDVTVQDVIGRIAQEGAYRSEIALYEGADKADQLRYRGTIAAYEGRAKENASYIAAASSVARYYGSQGGGSLFSKYGMTGGSGVGGNRDAGDLVKLDGYNAYDLYGAGP